MIASKSPLNWKQFGILQWEQNFVEPGKDVTDLDPIEIFKDYQIDVDFSHATIEENLLQVFLKIGINDIEKPKPGYRISMEAIGIFDTSQTKELDEDQRHNLEVFATTNLMIGRLRGVIPMLSGQGPFGPYNLPSLDLNDLLQQKMKSVNEVEEAED
jgi:preprotein translocase subunit SecB